MNELITMLSKTMAHYPELRAGQLLTIASKFGGWKTDDIFYCPDEILIAGLKAMIEKVKEIEEGV